ncbi:hypothetical protein E2P81_ATG00137 [Venturia nashicola]|nr:hypothetical protein E2P81_ATG00137 [Venturia nashicola]
MIENVTEHFENAVRDVWDAIIEELNAIRERKQIRDMVVVVNVVHAPAAIAALHGKEPAQSTKYAGGGHFSRITHNDGQNTYEGVIIVREIFILWD